MEQIFCKNCGTSTTSKNEFCPNCGTAVTTLNSEKQVGNATTRAEKVVRREPLSTKKKVGLSIIGLLAALAIGAHFLVVHLTDSKQQLQAIHNAIVDENGKALSTELHIIENAIYDEDNFVKSLKHSDYNALITKLSTSIDSTKETGLNSIVVDSDGIELFRVIQEKFLYFYPKIKIEPIAYPILVNSEIDNSTIEIAGTTYELDGKPFTIEKVIPSDYLLKLSGKNAFFESTGDILINKYAFKESIEIDLLATDYSITFGEAPAETILYINDESTKKPVKDITEISPVFSSGASFHAERKLDDGKTEKSDEIKATPGDILTFTFPLLVKAEEEAEKKAISEAEKVKVSAQQAEINQEKIYNASILYNDYRYAYQEALNDENFSYIENFLYGSGEAYTQLRDFIWDIEEYYYSYNFLTNEVLGGEVIDDKVYLNVYEVFNYTGEDGETTRYERWKEYILIEVTPNQFQIFKININDTNKN